MALLFFIVIRFVSLLLFQCWIVHRLNASHFHIPSCSSNKHCKHNSLDESLFHLAMLLLLLLFFVIFHLATALAPAFDSQHIICVWVCAFFLFKFCIPLMLAKHITKIYADTFNSMRSFIISLMILYFYFCPSFSSNKTLNFTGVAVVQAKQILTANSSTCSFFPQHCWISLSFHDNK